MKSQKLDISIDWLISAVFKLYKHIIGPMTWTLFLIKEVDKVKQMYVRRQTATSDYFITECSTD